MKSPPSFQFYPADWLRDPAVRSISLEARGLWIDMLCIAHECVPYGHLRLCQKDILPGVLARMVGSEEQTVEHLLAELEAAGVFSRTNEGTIYSRRMVRDYEIRTKRAQGGALSAKNPNVPRRKDRPHEGQDGPEGYPSGCPSDSPSTHPCPPSFDPSLGVSPSSSSSSSSSSKREKEEKSVQPVDLNGHADGFAIFWRAYPRKQGKKDCQRWWAKHRPNDVLLGLMLAKLEHAKTRPDWKKDGGSYVPMPYTWLNGERWQDEYVSTSGKCEGRIQTQDDRFIRSCGKPEVPGMKRCRDCLEAAARRRKAVDEVIP